MSLAMTHTIHVTMPTIVRQGLLINTPVEAVRAMVIAVIGDCVILLNIDCLRDCEGELVVEAV